MYLGTFPLSPTIFLLSSETTATSNRAAGSLCSSTLERLKGFTCSSEPSAGRHDTQREDKKTDGASSKICDQGSSTRPPRDVTDQQSNNDRPQQMEEEHDEDEEAGSGPAATKQVPNNKVDSITSLSSEFGLGSRLGQEWNTNIGTNHELQTIFGLWLQHTKDEVTELVWGNSKGKLWEGKGSYWVFFFSFFFTGGSFVSVCKVRRRSWSEVCRAESSVRL